jgi:hypothetical protein
MKTDEEIEIWLDNWYNLIEHSTQIWNQSPVHTYIHARTQRKLLWQVVLICSVLSGPFSSQYKEYHWTMKIILFILFLKVLMWLI